MKITKLVHSCMLVEHDGKKALVDPGNFSWDSGLVDHDNLRDIDYVLVTHAHADHLDKTFCSVVNELSPNAIWFVTESTKEIIGNYPGIHIALISELNDVKYISSDHADLTHWNTCKDHTSFVLFDELLIGGDCHALTSMYGASIFAAAINGGPWGSILSFLNMIDSMTDQPKKVIPLHDWHWNDQARDGFYARLPEVLEVFEVEFVPIENGVTVEL